MQKISVDTNVLLEKFQMSMAEPTHQQAIYHLFTQIRRQEVTLFVSQYGLLEVLNTLRIKSLKDLRRPQDRVEAIAKAHTDYECIVEEIFKYPDVELGNTTPNINVQKIISYMGSITARDVYSLKPYQEPVDHFDLILVKDASMAKCDVFYTFDTAILNLGHQELLGDMKIIRPS